MRQHLSPRLAAALLALAALACAPAHAGIDAYTGSVMPFAGNFCPRDWMPADGSELRIAQNPALFSLLGITYGGDGRDTFRLPDLRGRTPVGSNREDAPGGPAPGLALRSLGDEAGATFTTLTPQNMPAHIHTLPAATSAATHAAPGDGRTLAQAQNAGVYASSIGAPQVALGTSSSVGANAPFERASPTLAVTWCIAVYGDFPPFDNPLP